MQLPFLKRPKALKASKASNSALQLFAGSSPAAPAKPAKGLRGLFKKSKGPKTPPQVVAKKILPAEENDKVVISCSLGAVVRSAFKKCGKAVKKVFTKTKKAPVAPDVASTGSKPSPKRSIVSIDLSAVDWSSEGLPLDPKTLFTMKKASFCTVRAAASNAVSLAGVPVIFAGPGAIKRYALRRNLGANFRFLRRPTGKVSPAVAVAAAGVEKTKKKAFKLPSLATIKMLLGKKVASAKILALAILNNLKTQVQLINYEVDANLRAATRDVLLASYTLIAVAKAAAPTRRPRSSSSSSCGSNTESRRRNRRTAGLAAGLRKRSLAAKARAGAIVAAFSIKKKNKLAAIAAPTTTAAVKPHRASLAGERVRALAASLSQVMSKKDKEWTKLADFEDPAATSLLSVLKEETVQAVAPKKDEFFIQALKREDWVQF